MGSYHCPGALAVVHKLIFWRNQHFYGFINRGHDLICKLYVYVYFFYLDRETAPTIVGVLAEINIQEQTDEKICVRTYGGEGILGA